MRVLIAHNRYRGDVPSGENRVVDAEIALLRQAGVEVVPFLYSSDALVGGSVRALAAAAVGPVYAWPGVRDFRAALIKDRPDVVHLHNVFPMISPYVVRVAAQAGVPVVQTVHNFRHSCLNGMHLRGNQVCTSCLGRRIPVQAVRHGCYRDSRVQTLSMVAGQLAHGATWRLVSKFLALTPFMRSLLVEHGLPAERIAVRPAWVADTGHAPPRGRDFLFVGRLDAAKGVSLLLQAWELAADRQGRRLRIVGDGPLAEQVAAFAASRPDVMFSGPLPESAVAEAMAEAACVVAPSLCFEGYGLVLAEAFARGRPAITVSGGSMATIVDGTIGWIADPTPASLAAVFERVVDDDIARRGAAARLRYEAENSPAGAAAHLLDIYGAVALSRPVCG